MEDNHRQAVRSHVNPAQYGYVPLSEHAQYESGWHPHQTDDPKKILAKLHAKGIRRVLFRISGVGQFDIAFETWFRPEKDENER
jgi:hypothetical protein